MTARSRRGFLSLAAGSVGAALVACSPRATARRLGAAPAAREVPPTEVPTVMPTPALTPTPRPVPAAGRSERALLAGTPWETPLVVTHSGVRGPTVLVLGGVHGNEPGGWLAAEEVAGWTPKAGSLLVIPRANVVATRALERTLPELGDLNRLYPGAADAPLPMARMAATVVEVAREFGARFLLDMHESWGFYAERVQNGTAFLGQTIAAGQGPGSATLARELAALANAEVGRERDRLWTRDQLPLAGVPTPSPSATRPSGFSTSSLGAGRYVPDLTPILVEMGQHDQPLSRRVELHTLVARVLLGSNGML